MNDIFLHTLLILAAISIYCAAGGVQAGVLTGRLLYRKHVMFLLGLVAVSVHALLLYHWIDLSGGQNLTFFNTLSQVAWTIALLLLIVNYLLPVANLAVFIFPFAAVTIILAWIFPGSNVINTAAVPKQLFHILLSFLAMAVFFIAATQALLLTLQDYLLRHGHLSGMVKTLPPLETMEGLLFQMISLGFVILSLVLITSVYYFSNIFAKDLLQHSILAIVAWLVYGVLLIGRSVFGWRGRVAIRWTLSGFVLLVMSYFGSRFLLELLI